MKGAVVMISTYLSEDHQRCDTLFADVEEKVASGGWEAAAEAFETMRKAIEHHFDMEEAVFFPRFEEASGMTMGPTQVMRHEHEQMRGLFASMADALAGRDVDAYLGDSETLLIMMQQHNAKEEQILYPMLDAHLQGEAGQLIEEAKSV